MIHDWIKSSLQGMFSGLLASGLYRLIIYCIGCHPLLSIIAPLIALTVVGIVAYFGLKLFFKYASYSTMYRYISFFGGISIGSLTGWIIWGIKKFC